MKWYQDTEVEETWVFDKKKDKMVLRNRKVIRQGDTKLVKSNLKISKVK
jgi:hypothetical protein|tara:strand:+ start:840 stop:986 length:147 start_codon:yes stop_codon:yes gene_type:complete